MNLKKCASVFLVCTFMMTGCSASTKTEDGKDVVATLENEEETENIFADDLYSKIVDSNSNKGTVFNAVLQSLINKKFPVDKDMEAEADSIIEQVEQSYISSYGEDAYEEALQEALTSSGYQDMDHYRTNLIQQIQYANFLLDYIDNNYDTVFDDYYHQCSPKYISLIKVSVVDMSNPTTGELQKVEEIQALLATDKTFDEIAADYSDDTTSASKKGNLGIYDSVDSQGLSNTYDSSILAEADNLAEGQVSGAIEGDDGYYFIKVTTTNYDTIKEDLKDTDVDSPLLAYDDYLQYLAFSSYEITYDDEQIQSIVEECVAEALAEREETRGGSDE